MQCKIEWIDDSGNPTPDCNHAVALVRCLSVNSQWIPCCAEHLARARTLDNWESAPLDWQPYYTILIPAVPATFRTEWHPTEDSGPFATLTRGAFKSVGEAIAWARRHLDGAPYEIRCVD